MTQIVRVRDVVRDGSFDLGPEQPVLRVPYDAFQPAGPVHLHGALVDWLEKGVVKTGRTAPARLGDTHPGERVLVQVYEGPEEDWWLCEVENIDGNEMGS